MFDPLSYAAGSLTAIVVMLTLFYLYFKNLAKNSIDSTIQDMADDIEEEDLNLDEVDLE